MSKQHYRVLVIDDSEQAREAIRMILGSNPAFEVVAEGASGEEVLALTEQWMPDLILMDIRLPGIGGLEATKLVKENYPYVKVVMVTASDDITHLFDALKKGAQGYLLKNLQPESWHEYLQAICDDEAPMTRELAFRILKEFSSVDKNSASISSPLTAREHDILNFVAKGLSNRDISTELQISEHTVKNHLKNILHKLHLENRVQLARYAYEHGWIGGKGG
ncbi:DNA-binding response regulator [Xylanibacillus composti]|uniref:DNA-binding response regulator n=1 Tax=Xylanibacillus composti TaxID=1572762 RepID=A0A8J4H4X2_9BACL|nr:response regulator transcription factor [Xylanibacillus composti]MDT9726996.1 DNA-binding response regulator [Xylanibacillus composti]GIQ69556.1 DNA-binding response regulator [Xylanibacillus composti]